VKNFFQAGEEGRKGTKDNSTKNSVKGNIWGEERGPPREGEKGRVPVRGNRRKTEWKPRKGMTGDAKKGTAKEVNQRIPTITRPKKSRTCERALGF